MKQLTMFALVLITFVAAPNAYAKKSNKGKAAPSAARSDILAKYDTNNNGKLDASEKDRLIKEFYTSKTRLLKALDTNKDGILSSREIAAISATAKTKGKVKGKVKKHK